MDLPACCFLCAEISSGLRQCVCVEDFLLINNVLEVIVVDIVCPLGGDYPLTVGNCAFLAGCCLALISLLICQSNWRVSLSLPSTVTQAFPKRDNGSHWWRWWWRLFLIKYFPNHLIFTQKIANIFPWSIFCFCLFRKFKIHLLAGDLLGYAVTGLNYKHTQDVSKTLTLMHICWKCDLL